MLILYALIKTTDIWLYFKTCTHEYALGKEGSNIWCTAENNFYSLGVMHCDLFVDPES